MWAILKYDKKKIESLKKDFSKKLDKDFIIYYPKSIFQKYKNNILMGNIKTIINKKELFFRPL